jgi:chromosome partitioning protein
MTTIFAFISQKGGVGKSTGARALACEAARAGLKTKIADLDTQQGTTVEWHRKRLHALIKPVIEVQAFATAAEAIKHAGAYDIFIIDAPARASKGTLEIAKVADLVIQPTGVADDDLRPAVKEFHALMQAGIPRAKLAFALNHVGTEAEETDARAYIAEAGYAALGCLMERPGYRRAMNVGRSVTETSFPKLNEQADAFVQALIDRIGDYSDGRPVQTEASGNARSTASA